MSGDSLQYRQGATGITTGSAFRPWSRTGPHRASPKLRCSWTGPGPFLAGPFDLYSIPSVGPGADPGVQAVGPQVTVSHPPGGRLPLLSARPAVTSPAAEHHCPLASTKLYCLVTEAHRYEQLAQGCYTALPRVGIEPATY